MTITKTCNTCEHFPNDKHCIGCNWDKSKGENSKWELKENPIVIERKVLDKIRAEIEKHTDGNNHCDEYLDGYNDGMKDALDILDKYRKGEQE